LHDELSTHIWFRSESKPQEERAALTPEVAGKLVQAGFRVTVEESSERAFSIDDYQSAGCAVAAAHSWPAADSQAIILGLKELRTSDQPLRHRHIHFAHVYKDQQGWQAFLRRYIAGGGTHYDLEYLVDDDGRRVAAFGHWAGFAGAALAIQAWCGWLSNELPVLPSPKSSPDQEVMLAEIGGRLRDLLQEKKAASPRALVIGANGRSGQGAVEACQRLGLTATTWDVAETGKGGPFPEILEFDILVNCVFVQQQIPPFLTRELLARPKRRLRVICDVSCDPYADYNPLPIYDRCTSFQHPTLSIDVGDQPLFLIAIDHLPSLLPVESSLDFCEQLLPILLQLDDLDTPVWKRARELFQKKCLAAQSSTTKKMGSD